jgi:hypothetical protein
VEAMMLHVGALAAVFVDQVTQAPVVVKCVQTAPEPEWKWWLGALAPWVGPILSTAGSIYVAWRVFRWQGKKDRAHWLLDQKKAAWSQLMDAIHDCHFYGEYGEIQTRRTDTKPRLASIIALDRNRMLRIDQLLNIMKIWIGSKVVCSIQHQLSEFKKLRINYEDEGETPNSAGSKLANASWFPSTNYAEFVDAVCAAAREDLGIKIIENELRTTQLTPNLPSLPAPALRESAS